MKDPKQDKFSKEIISKAIDSMMLIMAQSDEGEITVEMLSTAYLNGYYDGMTKATKMIKEGAK